MTAAVWLILIVSALAVLQSKYFSKYAFRHLTYERKLSKKAVFEGESLELMEVIANHKLTPLPWLRVESKMSPWLRFRSQENLEVMDDRFHRSVFYLRPYSKITRRYHVKCIRRGYYDLSITTLTIGDLFGLNSTSQEAHSDAKLFVYPSLLGEDELPDEALRWQGDVSVKRWIFPDPILINGIRGYQLGDSRKDIHWKASARSGTLQVKTHDYTVFPRLLIIFNIDPEDNFWGQLSAKQMEEMEYGIRSVATLCNWAINNNMEVGLYSNASISYAPDTAIAIEPACNASQMTRILETLAGLQFKEHESIYRTLESLVENDTTNTDILVFSTFWNESFDSRCEQLRLHGNSVTHITLRKEAIRFEDIDSADAV
ncbi:MAG: DUF58 domain-containing protein [Oscillospiraceae bacterium]|nr:DUF58 domain-containing protein [Oscillospiraceae bacterium]